MSDFVTMAVKMTGEIFDAERDGKIQDRLLKLLRSEAELIAERSRTAAPKFTGALRESIVPRTREVGTTTEVAVEAGVAYAVTINVGRKPAFTPIKPLILWFQKQVGLSEKEAVGAAIKFSRKRAKTGTKKRKVIKTAGSRKRMLDAIKAGVLPD